jgi:UV DNA damage repair endonuclease
MIRLGLCCIFREAPIRFRTTTATSLARKPRPEQLGKLNRLCLENAAALQQAVSFCAANGIGAFRVNSQILPLKTHPKVGYDVKDLPDGREIEARFKEAGRLRNKSGLRLSFHISSPRGGWKIGEDPKPHADMIDPSDFPACWETLDITVEVEAKAKEPAVYALRDAQKKKGAEVFAGQASPLAESL